MSTYTAKRPFAIGVLGLLVLSALVKTGIAYAYTSDSIALFPSINVLGIGVLAGDNSSQLVTVDMTDATTTESITLPSVIGRDGEFYIVKRVDWAGYTLQIAPSTGEEVDVMEDPPEIAGGDSMTFVADEDAGTWWIAN